MRAHLLLVLGSACAIPDQKLGALACAGDPLPTTAPAELAISGAVVDPFGTNSTSGLTVAAMPTGFSTMTDSMGDFAATLMTGGVPSTDYLKVTGGGFVDSYFYSAEPVAADLQVPLQIYTAGELAMIGSIGSDSEQIIVSVEDCAGSAVAGATITTQSGTVIYFAQNQPDPTAMATDALTGAAIIVGVTGSNTTLIANTPEVNFRMHAVGTLPGTLTETAIQP